MRFPLTIDFGWPSAKPWAEYAKPQLKKIGIDVTVRTSAGFPAWAKTVRIGTLNDCRCGVQLGDPVMGTPDIPLRQCQEGRDLVQHQQYCNPDPDGVC
ncbi:MAG: hypothetical protein Ct9H300mP16_17830 [Pseudomonadota bacterium]|nr:MAG: hypothetical protein Ct9H300mP16_17830 [Pseudomonadota bacterium]